MTNDNKQLSQWLLDFAEANGGGFAPEQIQKLNEAANAISALAGKTNGDLTAINFVTEKPITIGKIDNGFGLVGTINLEETIRLLSADVKFADDSETRLSETEGEVYAAIEHHLIQGHNFSTNDLVELFENFLNNNTTEAQMLVSEALRAIILIDGYDVEIYRLEDDTNFWRTVAELTSNFT